MHTIRQSLRFFVLGAACLAVLGGLLLPHQFWVNRSCCRTSLSLSWVAPGELCPMAATEAETAGGSDAHFSAPSCCQSQAITIHSIPQGLSTSPAPDIQTQTVRGPIPISLATIRPGYSPWAGLALAAEPHPPPGAGGRYLLQRLHSLQHLNL